MNVQPSTTAPQWEFEDHHLERLCKRAWDRLPSVVKNKAGLYINKVSDDGTRAQSGNADIGPGCMQRAFTKFSSGDKYIQFFKTECVDVSDAALVGAFVHEVAHAFKTANVPDPTNPCYLDAIEHAGDALPSEWCFSKEIAALIVERAQMNPPVIMSLPADVKEENDRWKDYANALLIAMPVLLAGLTIADRKTWFSIVSGFTGLVGVVLVVLWYGRDRNYSLMGRYPIQLYFASMCFGAQAASLAFAILFR